MKKIILILIAFTAIAAGCQKYEDGPCISFRSAKNRLYGTHTLTKYTIDGVDSLQEIVYRFGSTYEFYYSSDICSDVLYISGGGHYTFRDPIVWLDQKKTIRLERGADLVTLLNPNSDDLDLEILRLKNNDIHFRSNYKEKEYYFELSN